MWIHPLICSCARSSPSFFCSGQQERIHLNSWGQVASKCDLPCEFSMGPKKSAPPTSTSKPVKHPSGQPSTAPSAAGQQVSTLPKVEIKSVKTKSTTSTQVLQLPQIVSCAGNVKDFSKAPTVPTSLSEDSVQSISVLISTDYIAELLCDFAVHIVTEEIANEKVAKKARENGKVKLLYEMYAEEFTIVDGKLSAAVIDEEYCLSYVMPNCCIHLSQFSNRGRLEHEANGNYASCTISEQPVGTFHGLEVGRSYHVFIEQESEQLKRDQELMKQNAKTMEGAIDPSVPKQLVRNDGRALEGCSCIYGNPCLDEYACRDWSNRFAISTKNGWKGF
jgi:hypothetical protein